MLLLFWKDSRFFGVKFSDWRGNNLLFYGYCELMVWGCKCCLYNVDYSISLYLWCVWYKGL